MYVHARTYAHAPFTTRKRHAHRRKALPLQALQTHLQTQNQVSIMVQTGRGRTSGERAQGARLRASVRCTQAQGGTWGLTFEEVELLCSSSETPEKRMLQKCWWIAMDDACTYHAVLQGMRMVSTCYCYLRSLPDPRPVAQGSPVHCPPFYPTPILPESKDAVF